jgi:hypothetical protein
MKSRQMNSAYLVLVILLNFFLISTISAQKPVQYKQIKAEAKNINLGCITKQVYLKAEKNNGLLIKSNRFVFYINRKQKNLLFVSNKLTFSKGEFYFI